MWIGELMKQSRPCIRLLHKHKDNLLRVAFVSFLPRQDRISQPDYKQESWCGTVQFGAGKGDTRTLGRWDDERLEAGEGEGGSPVWKLWLWLLKLSAQVSC